MHILLDTDVVLDFLLQRNPWIAEASAILEAARMALPGRDFEDNIQIAAAQQAEVQVIVTRDQKGYVDSPVRAMRPAEFAKMV